MYERSGWLSLSFVEYFKRKGTGGFDNQSKSSTQAVNVQKKKIILKIIFVTEIINNYRYFK